MAVTISGSVKFPNGANVVGAKVQWSPSPGYVYTNSQGNYSATIAAPGTYSFSVSKTDIITKNDTVVLVSGANVKNWTVEAAGSGGGELPPGLPGPSGG